MMKSRNSNEDGFDLANVKTILENVKNACDSIPVQGNYSYFTAFPEYTTMCSNIQTLSIMCFQRLFDSYEPNNGLSLLEMPHIDNGGDYEIISQMEDFIFALVDSSIENINNTDNSTEAIDKLVETTQKRIHFPMIEYNITEKPQNKFDDLVDTLDLNFAPKLRIKHNARRKWINEQISRIPGIFFQDDYMRELGIDPKTQLISIYRNPYSFEIHNIEYPDWEKNGDLSFSDTMSLEDTPFIIVDTEEGIKCLVNQLKCCRYISVSVIQHRYRSYLGYTSIIMISSPTVDYAVDAITLHSNMWLLNEVFTDPSILKIMYNSEEPTLWLQRDFGVFMVNMFDIQVAYTLLGKKRPSFRDVLMEQMHEFINMYYKRADWRTRPLTPEMILFARKNTHYDFQLMSGVVEELKNRSSEHFNRILEALAACNEICLSTYHKPVQTYETGEMVISDLGLILTFTQKILFLSMYYWRDVVARELDESVQYVLPLNHIVTLSTHQPHTEEELCAIMKPMSAVVLKRLDQVMSIVTECYNVNSDEKNAFSSIVMKGCIDGSPKLHRILETDRSLFNGITITDVNLPQSNASLQKLADIEAMENPTKEQQLRVLLNRGKFRLLSSSDDPADKYLVYSPNTLPYNSSAPLRNTVPYIPLSYSEGRITVDRVIPEEFFNPSVERFVDGVNAMLSPEILEEHKLIRDQLGLNHIRSELCHLGSVVEDDVVSLSSDAEDAIKEFGQEFGITLPEGMPPQTLKEIYQLPHKGKEGRDDEGDDDEGCEDGEAVSLGGEDICRLLGLPIASDSTDSEFMREIGWTDDAAKAAEYASQHIMSQFQ